MPFRKRLCLTALAFRFEVEESSIAAAASIRASESRVMTAMEEVNERDDRALLRDRISLLMRERRYFRSMASSYEREAVYARHAWSHSEDRSTALESLIRAQEAHTTALEA
ncbi:hypothetical protein Tco_0957124 [Tanacetum coccineum]